MSTLRNVVPVSCLGPPIFARTPTACAQPPCITLRHVRKHDFFQALLVGILGEDRITCVDGKMLGSSFDMVYCVALPLICFSSGVIALITFCVLLLNNEATQVMGVNTFSWTGYRRASVVGLVVCVSALVAVLALILTMKVKTMRMIEKFRELGTASLN